MIDLASIQAAMSGIGVARTALTTAFELTVDNKVRGPINDALTKLGAIQDTLYTLREENLTLQAENDRLKREAAARDEWSARFGQYDLISTNGGAIVYSFKGQPQHFACPRCVNDRRIEILQDKQTASGLFKCPGCQTDFMARLPERMPPIDYSGGGGSNSWMGT
jgi:hypothetical protein